MLLQHDPTKATQQRKRVESSTTLGASYMHFQALVRSFSYYKPNSVGNAEGKVPLPLAVILLHSLQSCACTKNCSSSCMCHPHMAVVVDPPPTSVEV